MGTDNLLSKKRAGRKKREVEVRNHRTTTWLLLTEGEKTEISYFNGFVDYLNRTGSRKIEVEPYGLGTNTKNVATKAEDYFAFYNKLHSKKRIPYEKIIFVFDRDSFPKEHFNTAIQMAKQRYPNCIVAWSNESFELWLRLHFEYVSSAQTRYQHNDRLTDIFRDRGVFTSKQNYNDHGKSLANIFEIIVNCGGSYEAAIHNAKNLLKGQDLSSPVKINPATMVYDAVEALIEESITH